MNHDRRRVKAAATTILAGVLFLAPGARAATAPIYKCQDGNLGLVYTDQPCKGGKQIDIHPGDANPAAAARLAKARDELDRSAAARIVELRRAAAQREFAAWAQRQREQESGMVPGSESGTYPADDDFAWYPAYLPARPSHSSHAKHQHASRSASSRGFAPSPPYAVPRSRS